MSGKYKENELQGHPQTDVRNSGETFGNTQKLTSPCARTGKYTPKETPVKVSVKNNRPERFRRKKRSRGEVRGGGG